MLQPKDTKWLNGYRNKTHIYAVDKKPNSYLIILRTLINLFSTVRLRFPEELVLLLSRYR